MNRETREVIARAVRSLTVGDVFGALCLFISAYIGLIWAGLAL